MGFLRSLGLVVALGGALVGCAAEPEDHHGPITIHHDEEPAAPSDGVDYCALAAQLPADDICSLACDPTAMAARLLADGSEAGACYQLYCALPENQSVVVGVCLPQ